MNTVFTKSAIGYNHLKDKKPCQDFSALYRDEERIILTCADGHGGELYIRSQIGSRFASNALVQTFLRIESGMLRGAMQAQSLESIRLNILCAWNEQVENHLRKHPIRKSETAKLNAELLRQLKKNPIQAYGTTLCGAMIFEGKILCTQIGDGGAFVFQKGTMHAIFEGLDEEQPGNLTYSLCEDNAFEHLHATVMEAKGCDALLLCTDGVINPYQNYNAFQEHFVNNAIPLLRRGDNRSLADFIVRLGGEKGNGDDVSLCMWLKN